MYAAASEDMDTLTFFTPKLAKNLMAPASADKPVMEIDTAKARSNPKRASNRTRFSSIAICWNAEPQTPIASSVERTIPHSSRKRGRPSIPCSISNTQVIEELGITLEQFVDICILCGCAPQHIGRTLERARLRTSG